MYAYVLERVFVCYLLFICSTRKGKERICFLSKDRKRERERERETDRQTDKNTDRQNRKVFKMHFVNHISESIEFMFLMKSISTFSLAAVLIYFIKFESSV